MIQYGPIYSKVVLNSPRRSRMELHGSNCLNWSSIVYNIFKIVQNGPKWRKLSQNKPQMVKQKKGNKKIKYSKRSKIIQNGQQLSKWFKIIPYCPIWSRMVQNDPKWILIVHRLYKMVQMVKIYIFLIV